MLTIHDTATIRRIEDAIGYTFNDKRLLVQVLTRKTYLKIDPEAPDNEVLEFYGDTLMNYHVTNYFMSKYDHMLEDGLFFMRTVEQFTDMRSHYVCNRYLTERVKAMGLARYLRAQNRDAELRRDGEKVYADIFESLVGAIYLDSYQNEALIRAFILRQLGIEPKRLPDEIEAFDYDTLQTPFAEDEPAEIPGEEAVPVMPAEIIPAEMPADLPDESSPEVTVDEGSTNGAEEAAESVADVPPAEPASASPDTPMQSALSDFCLSMGYEQPTYGETPKNAPHARPVAACTLRYTDAKGKLVKISLNDSGRNLAEATEKAAAKMLKKLQKQVSDTEARRQRFVKETVAVIEESESPAPAVPEMNEQPKLSIEAAMDDLVTPVEVVEIQLEAVAEAVEKAVPETETAVEAEATVEIVVEAVADTPAEAVEVTASDVEKDAEAPAEAVEVIATEVVAAIAEDTPAATEDESAAEEAKPAAEKAKPTVKKTRSKSTATRAKKAVETVEAADTAEEKTSSTKAKKTTTRRTSKKAAVTEEAPTPVAEVIPSETAQEVGTDAVLIPEAVTEDKPTAEVKTTKTRKPRTTAKTKKAESPSSEG